MSKQEILRLVEALPSRAYDEAVQVLTELLAFYQSPALPHEPIEIERVTARYGATFIRPKFLADGVGDAAVSNKRDALMGLLRQKQNDLVPGLSLELIWNADGDGAVVIREENEITHWWGFDDISEVNLSTVDKVVDGWLGKQR